MLSLIWCGPKPWVECFSILFKTSWHFCNSGRERVVAPLPMSPNSLHRRVIVASLRHTNQVSQNCCTQKERVFTTSGSHALQAAKTKSPAFLQCCNAGSPLKLLPLSGRPWVLQAVKSNHQHSVTTDVVLMAILVLVDTMGIVGTCWCELFIIGLVA